MNWEAIGAIAEGLGAAGVLATLVYLVGQVRTNNRLLRSESERASTELTNQTALKIAESRDLAELFQKGVLDPDQLDGPDRGRFIWLMASLVNQEQLTFFDRHLGLKGQLELGDLKETYESVLDTPGGQWWWARNRNRYFPAFVEHIDREIFAD